VVGRNERCPCGKKKKYRKCCGLAETASISTPAPASVGPSVARIPIEIRSAILQEMNMRAAKEQLRRARYGQVRPEIAAKHKGYQFVAVGSKMHYSKGWKTFSDFLLGYVPATLGKDWWKVENEKAMQDRHQVCQWFEAMRRYAATARVAMPDGTYRVADDGFGAAFLTFAYDVYIVEHNGRLDSALVERLKNKDQFQGARHELFAEATCLRAGFTIERENERDRAHKHAEFVATHEQSGMRFSVEAKSKHRAGVLGMPGLPQPHNKLSLAFGQLINNALAKNPPHPLVVFIDTNLPTRAAQRLYAPRIEDGKQIPSRLLMALLDRVAQEHNDKDPYAFLIFSNHPHHYKSPEELQPQKNLLAASARSPDPAWQPALEAFVRASSLYGNIPNDLPEK
jgi:hypothetical protein